MTFNQYQDRAIKTAVPKAKNVTYMVLGLANEAGEVAGKLKKILRGDSGELKHALLDELGDVLWYVAGVATQFGIDLEVIAQRNIEKLESRQQRGKIQGDGDER